MFPRDMVCLRNISVDTLHKGDTEDDDDVNNNNDDDNNNRQMLRSVIKSTTAATTMGLLLLSFHYNSETRWQEHHNMREITSLLLWNSNNGQFLLLHRRHQSHTMHCLMSPPGRSRQWLDHWEKRENYSWPKTVWITEGHLYISQHLSTLLSSLVPRQLLKIILKLLTLQRKTQ
jgi:hypothetical protein